MEIHLEFKPTSTPSQTDQCRMGVHGLWPLLHPVARPVALETMGGKKLAIDSSIWLYQFQIAMRDKDGRALDNAHILGFLRRICKLLFYGIKPVSQFDRLPSETSES